MNDAYVIWQANRGKTGKSLKMSKLYTQISIFRPKMCFFKPPNRSQSQHQILPIGSIHPSFWTILDNTITTHHELKWGDPKKIFKQKKKCYPFILHSKNKSHTHAFWPPWHSTHLVALTIARRLWKSCHLCHWPGQWELCPAVWICDYTISLMVKFTFHITKS